jgi:hypothetical protein
MTKGSGPGDTEPKAVIMNKVRRLPRGDSGGRDIHHFQDHILKWSPSFVWCDTQAHMNAAWRGQSDSAAAGMHCASWWHVAWWFYMECLFCHELCARVTCLLWLVGLLTGRHRTLWALVGSLCAVQIAVDSPGTHRVRIAMWDILNLVEGCSIPLMFKCH